MWILPLLFCAWVADAKSGGIYLVADQYGCDFDGSLTQWGCQTRTWNASNDFAFARGFCQDANFNTGKFMWWTGAPMPVPANMFSMRTGDGNPSQDPTTYTPGRWVSVYIRVLTFNTLYKGLLLYAKNSNNTKVGDWIVPFEASPQFASYGPQLCNRSVMHINAEDKPYLVKFNFITPPAGTGPITIKAMVKTGPPNPTDYGNFYRLQDIVLQEEPTPNDLRKWVLLPTGQSCKDYCDKNKQDPCSDAALSSSIDGIQPNPLDTIYPCHGAQFHDCTGNPRVANPGAFCTYHASTCPTGASCSAVPDATTPLFCVCGAPITGISGTSSLAPGLAAIFSLVFAGMWGSKSNMIWGTLILMLSAMPIASAHNWMEGTRGRASNLGANQFCTPTFPQANRNAIHLQVGAGQNFVVEWAAAHTDYTYWIMISDDARANVSKLTRSLMDNWLSYCPGGGAANSTATGMKYHRFRPNQNLASSSPVNGQSASSLTYANLFKPQNIWNGSVWNMFSLNGGRPTTFYQFPGVLAYSGTPGPDVITPFNKTLYPTTCLAEYYGSQLGNDRRCSYTNASNPWIISIHRYLHQDVSMGFATAVMSFPTNTPAGRYQLHYKWSSYCDVIDVDVKAAPTQVTAPYGTPINATNIVYDTAHHCWFETPRLMGQCIEVVTSPQQCQAICSADNACRAFQMLPLQMDTSAGNSFGLFPESSYIPWLKNNAFCDKSKFTNAKPGSQICFPIYSFQDDFNSARPLWSFTDDPDHQGFYGTCYIKPRAVQFLPFAQVANDAQNLYRFHSKCIPCDNIGQDLTNPRWGPQQNYCTDCSKQSVPARTGPRIPTMTWIANATFSGKVTWLSPAGTPYAMQDECAYLASIEPTCSKYIMYSDLRAQRLSGKTSGLPPTATSQNVNSTAMYKLINTTQNWHFTNYALTAPYYRTCGCLPNPVTGQPPVDPTGVANACDGVMPNQCVVKGFNVYSIA